MNSFNKKFFLVCLLSLSFVRLIEESKKKIITESARHIK